MKIAVFSDIHGNYQALKAILNNIGDKYDKVIFLGDAVGIGPDSYLCVKLLKKKNVLFLLGNHELYCTRGSEIDIDLSGKKLEHHIWVQKTLKDSILVDDNNLRYDIIYKETKISFFHYFLNNKPYPFEHLDIIDNGTYKEIYDKEEADYIFFGHNHEETYNVINNKKYFGIGSSGCTTNNKTYYYSIIIDNNNVKVKKIKIRYNRRKFVNRMNNIKYPDKENLKSVFFGL